MRRAFLTLAILALASQLPAELLGRTVGAVATSQTFTINSSELTIVNDGANEVYIRVFEGGETAAVATTAYPELKSGESLALKRTGTIQAISIVCAASETATVRLFYW